MTDYHLFKKPWIKNGKTVRRWYYYYLDKGWQVQKSCKGCSAKAEAEAYIRKLPPLSGKNTILIKTIAEFMSIPGSDHMKRGIQLGKPLDIHSMKEVGGKIAIILEKWGERTLESLTVGEVGNYLFAEAKSGSWKRASLNALRETYREAAWHGCVGPIPLFPVFSKKGKKADVFTASKNNHEGHEGRYAGKTAKANKPEPNHVPDPHICESRRHASLR